MTVKTITITEEAYRRIKGMKMPGESFSDLFSRLSRGGNSMERFFGVLSGKEADDAHKYVRRHREKVTEDAEERYARLGHLGDHRMGKRK